MKKSTKVKSKRVSKISAPKKRLKKYEEGGKEVQGVKRNSVFDSLPGSNMPTAPKGDAVTMNLKSEQVPANKQLKKIELPAGSPDFSGQGAYAVTPAKMDEKKAETVSAPKAKRIAGGFSSEAQKQAYIKNAKDMIAKGKTVDDLVKSRFGTKEGLKALGISDTPKKAAPTKVKSGTQSKLKVERKDGTTTMTRTTKRTTVVPKNAIASRVAMQGVTEKLPSSSKVPLKNNAKKGNPTASDLKQKGLQIKKEGQALKQKGAALKEKSGDKQYWKSKYYQNLVGKAASGQSLTTKERDLVWDKTTKKQDYGQKISDKESQARNKILKGATKKGKELFTDAAFTTASVVAPGIIGKGIKALRAAKAAKVLKIDKIIKPITKAIPRSTNAGKTIKVNGRTVSEGSQKLLGNGQKALGNGQKMLGNTKGLPAPKKGLPAPKLSAKSNLKLSSVAKGRAAARTNTANKIEKSIKTTNPVARSMARATKYDKLVKTGSKKITAAANRVKAKNYKPKPGDQLKLNLRKGGRK